MAPNLELVYFNVKARAEAARMMLAYGKIPYTDTRIERENWPAMKSSTPFGQVPILKIDGVEIAQSAAIDRYVGGLVGLLGDNAIETAKSDMIMASMEDLFAPMRAIFLEQDESKRVELREKMGKDHLEPWLTRVGGMLGEKKFFFGDKPCVADFVLTTFVPMVAQRAGQQETISKHKTITALVARVEALPGVKEWIEKRPKTDK